MDSNRPRYTIRVTRIVGLRVYGKLAGGTTYSVYLSVLAHGRRGSRLEEHADGTPAEPPRHGKGYTPTVEETKTASDYVRETKPKGVVHASERDREALAMREAGARVIDVARFLGVSAMNAAAAMKRARLARQDERHLGRTG
jgi:hypothetical protein